MKNGQGGVSLNADGVDREELEALRGAQLAILKHNRERYGRPLPSTWGAFVLSGEGR